MKKSLSLFVASSMVVSMFAGAAYAAEEKDPGEFLNELGVIQGDQNGDLMEDANWSRKNVTVLMSRLLGEEEEAAETEKDHEFTDVTDAYYDSFITWAVEEGLFEGRGDGTFGYNDDMTNQEFYAVVLRALGYDTKGPEAFAGVPDLAVELELATEDTDFDAVPTRGETYETIVAALNTEVKGTGETLGVKLGLIEVTELAVSSVEAVNLKEVKVVFNQAVDKTEAEKEENYKVYNGGASTDLVGGGTATLQADGKTVIITLGTALNNGTTAKVEVKNLVTYSNDAISVSDSTVPTVVGIQVTGPKTFTVEYSEPVNGLTLDAAEYTVDEGNYIVTTALANGSNKVDVTVGVNFTNGEHKVKFNGTDVADYAGYRVIPKTQTFTVVADTTAPTVAVKSVSPTQIKLVFSKPVNNVQDANVNYKHTFNNNTYSYLGNATYGTTPPVAVVTRQSSTEYTLDFSQKPIALGSNNLYISYESDSGVKIEDLWGNDLAATTLPLSVELDTVKPAVSEVKFVDAQTLKVTFSETVDETSAETASNYTIKDAAGKKVPVASATRGGTDNKEVTLAFAPNALGGGSYTVAIEKVKDTAFVANTMDAYASTLAVNDTVKPTVSDSKYSISGDNKQARIYIPFSEKMDVATLVKGNFLVQVNDDTTPQALQSDDTVTISADGKSVELKINRDSVTEIDAVTVGAVRDLAGNGLAGFSVNPTLEEDAVAVEKVEAIGTQKLKVTFDGRLSTVSATGYKLELTADDTDAGVALSVVSHTVDPDTNKSIVEFSLGAALQANAAVTAGAIELQVTGATGTKSYLGTLVDDGAVDVADKIAPTVSTVKVIDDETIHVTFTEALAGTTFATTANGFSVAGGDAKIVGPVTLDTDTKVVVIKGENFVANGTTVSYNEAAGLTDAATAGNKVASFTDKTATN